MTSALALDVRWRQLYCDSRTRDLRLVDTKDQFRTVTAQQDVVFREQVSLPPDILWNHTTILLNYTYAS